MQQRIVLDLKKPYQNFEDVVVKLLSRNGFSLRYHLPRGERGYDLDGNDSNSSWAIDIKYYRTPRVRTELIEAAASRVIRNGQLRADRKGMLVISNILPNEIRDAFNKKYPINILDRQNLRYLARNDPTVLSELDRLFLDENESSDEYLSTLAPDLDRVIKAEEIVDHPTEDPIGFELLNELKIVGVGKVGWSNYETVCIKVLKYLFKDELEGWHEQLRTDGGGNRYDLVCRIKRGVHFWEFLINDLNSRYVVFEFKNYSEKIKQGQILTTEKYLMERALRKVAIIISRGGADKNATKMIQGAMREQGKLILVLNDEDLAELVRLKMGGSDPSDHLFEKTDEFLLTLPR